MVGCRWQQRTRQRAGLFVTSIWLAKGGRRLH
jgi:hypothetical protein